MSSFRELIQQRNPHTHRQHRREVFWQITLPIILGALGILTGCGLSVAAIVGGGDVGVWRDISLIWLIVPALIVALIPLALLGASVYGVTKMLGVMPGFFLKVQNVFGQVRIKVFHYSDRIVEPVLKVRSVIAGIKSGLNKAKSSS